jgi:hypothetical protein
MMKIAFAGFLILMGVVELTLAFNENVRDALMKNSVVRFKSKERSMFLLAGFSALAFGLGTLLYAWWK